MNNRGQSSKHANLETCGILRYIIIKRNKHINIHYEMIKSVILFYIALFFFNIKN